MLILYFEKYLIINRFHVKYFSSINIYLFLWWLQDVEFSVIILEVKEGLGMKKFSFSKKNLMSKLERVRMFLKRHYVVFFKEAPLLFCFIITSLINTLLLRIITVGNFIYIKPLLADLGMIFILSSFMFLFKKDKTKRKYLVGLSLFISILCIIHSVYYTYYDSFASISLLATSTFVVDVGDAVVEQVLKVSDLLYLWQPIFVYYYYIKEKKNEKLGNVRKSSFERKFSFVNMITSGVILLCVTSIFVTKTEWSRFGKMWNRESVVSSFGILTYQVNDIFQSLEPKINNLFGHDNALKKVIEYYGDNDNTLISNDYSGIFKGKNVLVIHAESLQTLALNRSFNGVEVAPFLSKLASEGLYFSNFYSEVGVGTSSDAEFTFSTSLMPSSNGTVFVNYFDREYETIQKSFKSSGYYTFSMHGNTGDFWNRSVMHKNMGYDKFYSKSSFDTSESIGLGISDKSFFKQVVPKIQDIISKENKPFYGTLITLTNHTPWSDLDLMDEYDTTWTVEIDGEEVVRDYISDTTMGSYFRSVHYMDQAISEFITELDEVGILDNTVIVIYGDHDARISKKNYNLLYNYDPYTDTIKESGDEGYVDYNDYEYKLDKNVPFIIWTKDNQVTGEIKTATGMIDAYPILANLFGVECSSYALGHDVLGNALEDNTVVFTDGSYVTNSIYYNGQSGDFYPVSGEAVKSDYISNNSLYADNLIDISNDIITYDLIKEIKSKNKE